MATDRIILGIDPGTNIMGYGLIHIKGNKPSLITMGTVKMSKSSNHPDKLKKIFENTLAIIDEYHPDELSIEAPFYGKNVQAMLKLGRAQGVAMAAALYRSMPIYEYSPRKVKKSITGRGNASKEQVAAMLKSILNGVELDESLDATDGLALAMCHFNQQAPGIVGKKYSGWESFISQNKERVNG